MPTGLRPIGGPLAQERFGVLDSPSGSLTPEGFIHRHGPRAVPECRRTIRPSHSLRIAVCAGLSSSCFIIRLNVVAVLHWVCDPDERLCRDEHLGKLLQPLGVKSDGK